MVSGVGATSSSGTAGVITFGFSCSCIMVKATANAVIKLNDKSIAIDSGSHMYDVFNEDASSITIVSGTVDYVGLG